MYSSLYNVPLTICSAIFLLVFIINGIPRKIIRAGSAMCPLNLLYLNQHSDLIFCQSSVFLLIFYNSFNNTFVSRITNIRVVRFCVCVASNISWSQYCCLLSFLLKAYCSFVTGGNCISSLLTYLVFIHCMSSLVTIILLNLLITFSNGESLLNWCDAFRNIVLLIALNWTVPYQNNAFPSTGNI